MTKKIGRPSADVTNQRLGKLVALHKDGRTDKKEFLWKCICDCGNYAHATASDLKRGRTNFCKSCNDRKSKLSPIKGIYGNYKRHALNRGLSFEIPFEEFQNIIFKDCHYCGTAPIQYYKKKEAKEGIYYNGVS